MTNPCKPPLDTTATVFGRSATSGVSPMPIATVAPPITTVAEVLGLRRGL
jgi:hypothetical protein